MNNKFEVKMEIRRIPFTRLRKLELPALAKAVIEVVEKHNPDELHIEEVFNLFVAERPHIDELTAIYGVHPLTLKLRPLRKELMLYISSLRMQLKVASNTGSQDARDAATAIQLVFDSHLGKLNECRNEETQLEIVAAFLKNFDLDAGLQTAVSTLKLTETMDCLQATLIGVRELLMERLTLISQRAKKGKSKAYIRSVISAMDDLFKQIEVAQLKHTELDYEPLFAELNDTLHKFRGMINRREADNKRRNAEKQEDGTTTLPEEPEENEEDTGTTGGVTTMMAEAQSEVDAEADVIKPEELDTKAKSTHYPQVGSKNGDGSDKDFNQSLDQKKTAATSSKPLQLPDSKNEA